jgi:hypothetical protein
MKDNNQSANLRALIDAGVSSFKIEGRYKDMGYVKNITAHYRCCSTRSWRRAPSWLAPRRARTPSSSRPTRTQLQPRSTDYFVNGRKETSAPSTAPRTWASPWAGSPRWATSGLTWIADEAVRDPAGGSTTATACATTTCQGHLVGLQDQTAPSPWARRRPPVARVPQGRHRRPADLRRAWPSTATATWPGKTAAGEEISRAPHRRLAAALSDTADGLT